MFQRLFIASVLGHQQLHGLSGQALAWLLKGDLQRITIDDTGLGAQT